MLKSLLVQQFPQISVTPIVDKENTGNFIIFDKETVFSKYGFLTTAKKRSLLLRMVHQKYGP